MCRAARLLVGEEEGYGDVVPPESYRWIVDNGELVYGFGDRNFGLMGVYRLPLSC